MTCSAYAMLLGEPATRSISLTDRLSTGEPRQSDTDNEFQLIFPMGADNEMLAASAVEQVARRLSFTAEAINQIKTAVIEACINASEHSLSPDRKIYQRFQVENDRLSITISSRGILPVNFGANTEGEEESTTTAESQTSDDRRGWGRNSSRR